MNIIIDLTPFSALQCRVRNKKINILVYTIERKPLKNCVFFAADQKLPIWKCVRGLNLDGFVPFFV